MEVADAGEARVAADGDQQDGVGAALPVSGAGEAKAVAVADVPAGLARFGIVRDPIEPGAVGGSDALAGADPVGGAGFEGGVGGRAERDDAAGIPGTGLGERGDDGAAGAAAAVGDDLGGGSLAVVGGDVTEGDLDLGEGVTGAIGAGPEALGLEIVIAARADKVGVLDQVDGGLGLGRSGVQQQGAQRQQAGMADAAESPFRAPILRGGGVKKRTK